MIGYIYKITNPKGKIYIGQTCNIERRIKEYTRCNKSLKNQRLIYFSLLKYGFENHKFEIIYKFKFNNYEELNNIEIFFILFYNSHFYKNENYGLNLSIGGRSPRGHKHSDESKRKISEFHKNNKWWKGKKHTEETKQKMSQVAKGKKKKWTEEGLKNRLLFLKNYKHSKENNEKISKRTLGSNNPNAQLTEEIVAKIKYRMLLLDNNWIDRKTHIEGRNLIKIDFNISERKYQSIHAGESWKHVKINNYETT